LNSRLVSCSHQRISCDARKARGKMTRTTAMKQGKRVSDRLMVEFGVMVVLSFVGGLG
jgi:hypothetical protein